ncbi:MAG: IS21 family transposase [Planctomycetota bacterium]
MDDYELIRRKHLVDGMSQRAVARELGYARNSVAKAIANPIPPGYRLSQPRAQPKIDPVKPIIDAWLAEDRTKPRKQRHTAQRIYERLCDEYEFDGDPSTVRRYVQLAKRCLREVFMPLSFEPGEEAQVDWHEGWIEENGVQRKAQFYCMRLCYSKASFVWPYERANLESFLDGHVRAFDYFGGVPRRLAYDNLKSAVIQVGRGRDRRLNKRFRELRSWYLFDTRFCNVAKGNEKGDVENLAKRSERTYLTPIPAVGALAELGPKLLEDCRKDLDLPGPRPHEAKARRELFEEEKRCLLRLLEHPFPACRDIGTFIDKRSLVQVETNSYSAPVRWAHHPVSVKVFVDRVEVWCEHQRVAVHPRCYDKGQYFLEPEHYLMLLKIKPGSLDNARAFKGQPWGEDFDLMRRELEYRYDPDGTRKYINILLLFSKYPEEDVKQAVGLCVGRRAFSDEAVLGVLRNEPLRPTTRLNLSDHPELLEVDNGVRPAGIYDQLLDGEEVAA